MNTSVVFVANIPFYVYYNCPEISSVSPSYRSLVITEDLDGIRLTCFDAFGREVMPYPEYILAMFTYRFEVLGRYKKCLKIRCLDGVHIYYFYVDSTHNYGVSVDLCKEILSFQLDLPDCDGLRVTDYQGYELTRLLYVNNLDCFSPEVLRQLRFLKSSANCARVVAYSYMSALRLVYEPTSDLSGEMMIAIALSLKAMRVRDFSDLLCFHSVRVILTEEAPIYFTFCTVGNSLDRARKM